MAWWSSPTTHNAFVLAWASVIVTVVAAGLGLAIFAVSRAFVLKREENDGGAVVV
jgi:hypothetical protein